MNRFLLHFVVILAAAPFASTAAFGDVTLDKNHVPAGTYSGTVVAITYTASPVIDTVHFLEEREGAKNWQITNTQGGKRENTNGGEIERFAQLFQKAFDNDLVLTMKIDADGSVETSTLTKPKK